MEDDSDHRLLHFFKSLLRKKPHLEKGADLTEEIHDLMNEGQAMGFITNEISDMVYGVLDLKETKAHSIMIPRTEISSTSIDSTLGEAIDLVSSCGHTRIPIFKENIDEIAGMAVTLVGLPFNLTTALIGFIFFRILDIVKPFPIRTLDKRLFGGFGVVMDDVAAGIFANLLLRVIIYFK